MNRFWELTGADATYHLGQDLVFTVVPEVRQELNQLLKDGATHLIFDLEGVNIVDSTGIGCLVAAHNSLVRRQGSLEVVNVSEDLFDLFQSMRLNKHFSVQQRNS
jgi:anti-anti-sigma factor